MKSVGMSVPVFGLIIAGVLFFLINFTDFCNNNNNNPVSCEQVVDKDCINYIDCDSLSQVVALYGVEFVDDSIIITKDESVAITLSTKELYEYNLEPQLSMFIISMQLNSKSMCDSSYMAFDDKLSLRRANSPKYIRK